MVEDQQKSSQTKSVENRVPIVIDVQASGFGRESFPIEVGFVLGDSSTYCCLVRPEPNWTHWDSEAESIHGIGHDLLLRHGIPVKHVALYLNRLLGGEVAYSDAWGLDLGWLTMLFQAAGVPKRFKLEALREIMSNKQSECWSAVKGQVASEFTPSRRRASSEARILQLTYLRSCNHGY